MKSKFVSQMDNEYRQSLKKNFSTSSEPNNKLENNKHVIFINIHERYDNST